MVVCRNCGKEIAHLYCPYCGQKVEDRLTFTVALEDMLRGITNGDSGIFLTVKELFTRPGKMITEYLEGRRAVHFRPFPLLILLAGVFGLLDAWLGGDRAIVMGNIVGDGAMNFLNISQVRTMLFVPFLSLGSWILFRGKYNFIEHLYIVAFASIQWQLILFITTSLPIYFGLDLTDKPTTLTFLMCISIIAILTTTERSYRQIFKLSLWKSVWRIALILLFGAITFLLFLCAMAWIVDIFSR